ncbi:MAG: riboflavin synthase [Bdellovibrionales bacterium]|jgi:riboflavin synthase|nr:riboflavin synthase [Bdellovibrionales bacterium]
MFSGIVETTAPILRAEEIRQGALVRIWVARPSEFDDIKIGDSIANDGVCLTVEAFDAETIQFALAAETLAVTNWRTAGVASLVGRTVNLERSLRMGDRIHGHWVTGHVDAAARVVRVSDTITESGDAQVTLRILEIEIPKELRAMVWKKGSWALNGVSLTVNSVEGGVASHCLIPETLQRTNLGLLKEGDLANVEIDVFARALAQSVETYIKENGNLKESLKL